MAHGLDLCLTTMWIWHGCLWCAVRSANMSGRQEEGRGAALALGRKEAAASGGVMQKKQMAIFSAWELRSLASKPFRFEDY